MKTALAILLAFSTLQVASAQTFLTHDEMTYSFQTNVGVITVDHQPVFDDSTRFVDLDIRIRRAVVTSKAYELGSGEPSFFIDRRGHRVNIEVSSETQNSWITEQKFFPGESGLPVFDKSGKCVAVVLGNRRERIKWRGRVCKIFRAGEILPGSTDPIPKVTDTNEH